MAYTYSAWSVVFGEQPSAAKWNIIGTNMASFNERIGANFSSGTASPIWWEELGRTTLGVAGDTITVSGLAARANLIVYCQAYDTGGTIRTLITFNGDTGNNYAIRESSNGAADATTTATGGLQFDAAAVANPIYLQANVMNIAAREKLVHGWSVQRNAAGAASLPQRRDVGGKWVNTSNAISSVTISNSGTGDFATGSYAVVIGHD